MNIKKIIILTAILLTHAVIKPFWGIGQSIASSANAPADACVKIAGVTAMGNANIKASWGIPPCNVIDVSAIVADAIYVDKGPTNPTFASAGSPTITLQDSAPGQVKTLTITVKPGSCGPKTWTVKENQPLWSKTAMDAFNFSANSGNPGFVSRNMRFAAQAGLPGGCGLMGGTQECNSSNQCRGHCDYTCKGTGDYPDDRCCYWWGPIEGLSHSGWSTFTHGVEGAAGDVGSAFESAGEATAYAAEKAAQATANAAQVAAQATAHAAQVAAEATKQGFMVAAQKIEKAANDALPLVQTLTADSLVWAKDMGQAAFEELKTAGYLTKDVITNDQDDLNKNLHQALSTLKAAGIQTAGALVADTHALTAYIDDIFKNPEKPNYCPLDSVTAQHRNMPKTVDDPSVRAQDSEGLIDAIIKYAPTSFLFRSQTKGTFETVTTDELYQPMWADEYFTSPTSRFKVGSTGKEYLKGKVTFEKMYELYTKCTSGNADLYIENEPCAKYGSNPANNMQNGALTTPLYVLTSEADGKIYIEYLYFYGFNGPFDIGPIQGASEKVLTDLRDLHESDLEHITIELDKNTKQLTRIYYGSHGSNEGFWLDAKSPLIEWDGTHPIVYVAKNSHALYPKQGTYVRIFGMANDVTTRGQLWKAKLIRVYRDEDPRFDPKTMGWLYFSGKLGAHGIDSASGKPWYVKGPQVGDVGRTGFTLTPQAGDAGLNHDDIMRRCDNPSSSGGGVLGDLENVAEGTVADTEYANCLEKYAPMATIPD